MEIPKVGVRTIKKAFAVTISAGIMHYVFHQNPFFASIGAIVGVSSTRKTSREAIINKNVGMFIGGVVGMVIAYLTPNVLIKGMGVIPVIYAIDLSGRKESKISGCIMYFAIVYLNTIDTAAYYAVKSVTQTLFGSIIGIIITRKEVKFDEEVE